MLNGGSSFADGLPRLWTIWIVGNSLFSRFCTSQECREALKFGGGLGAVRTGIALFWATKSTPCTICNLCKAA